MSLVGCTRKAVTTSNVSLSFGAANSIMDTSAQPSTIIVNISGSGISPSILYNWDSHCGNSSCEAPPSSVTLAVPTGSARLIQVLLVYDNGSDFRYGDSTTDIVAGSNPVEITVESIGSSNKQAHVSARYLDNSPAGGPTGMMDARFQPGNGHPAMTVMRQQVFAGWMNLFLLDSSNFTYVLNGQPLFSDVNLNSPAFMPSASVMRISVPASNRNGGDSDDAQELIFGYFGHTSGQVPCYDNQSSVTISGVNYGTTSSPLMYSGVGSSPSQVYHEGGGLGYYPPAPTGICGNATTEFVDHMIFYEANLRNGHDSAAGFRGPFRLLSSGNWVDVSSANGSYVLNFNLLPGTTTGPASIAGVSAFVRTNPNGNNGGDGDISGDSGVLCSQIIQLGFTQSGSDLPIPSGTTAGGVTLGTLPSNPQIVVCPYVNSAVGKMYVDGGVSAYLNL